MLSPPLHAGDHLSRAEFERRYHAHPEIKKAELIEGIVHIPSPIHHKGHSQPHAHIITLLGTYCAATPGTDLGDNASVRLDFENEVQPDVLLRLETAKGGNSRISEDDYLEVPPELIVEIAASSAAYDMHSKRRVYARSGVREYVVVQVYERVVSWFILRDSVYELMTADEKGILRGELFPGLWLDTAAFWAGDLAHMLATLQNGLATSAQTDFVVQLEKA